MRLIVAALAAFAVCPANAQTGQAGAGNSAALSVGDSFDYRTSRGRRLRMTLTEVSDGRYHWELYDVTGEPRGAARITQDSEFRILAYEEAGGGTTRYEPHNCEKSVGVCTYTVHNPDGTTAEEMRVNGIEDRVWNFSLWKQGDGAMRPVGVGEICYDAAGLSLVETWTDLEGTAGYAVERILPDGTVADCTGAAE